MNGHWGSAGPPPEAYSRVTNPERFAILHDAASELLDSLEREFETERREGYGLDAELEQGCNLSRPSVALASNELRAAPLVIAFSAFPGVRVRLGRWYLAAFPACGCDACDETAEGEKKRLLSLVLSMVAGRFRESIQLGADGTVWKKSEFWSADGHSEEELHLDQAAARKLLDPEHRSSYEWTPWRRRMLDT